MEAPIKTELSPHSSVVQDPNHPSPPAAMLPSLPAGQLVHDSEPLREYCPHTQVEHAVDVAELYVPAGHTTQMPASAALHSPAAQAVQDAAPT